MIRSYWNETQEKAYESALAEFWKTGEVTIGINQLENKETITQREIVEDMAKYDECAVNLLISIINGKEVKKCTDVFMRKHFEKVQDDIEEAIDDYVE